MQLSIISISIPLLERYDMEIIESCIQRGLIYESLPYHNVIFLGMDHENIPRYASYRATNGKRIFGVVTGSDKRYSFRLMKKESQNIHIFESAIDLLSYATLLKNDCKNWQMESLLSLSGVYGVKLDGTSKVPIALQNCLEKFKSINRVYLHFDNDRAGKISMDGLKRALENQIEVIEDPPLLDAKDFNDYLLMKIKIETERKENMR